MSEPIDAAALRAALLAPAGPYSAVHVVASTGSTNADLRVAAAEGAADRTVLLAEEQTSGQGRRGRSWTSPPGAGIYLSVLLRPSGVAPERLGSLAVVAGLALLEVARSVGGDAVLKWPNDMLAGDGKLAGVLSELVHDAPEPAVVLGIGRNVPPLGHGEPGPGGLRAVSLAEAGARDPDRTALTTSLLHALHEREQAWRAAGGDLSAAGLLDAYRAACATLNSRVRVLLPDGELEGEAVDIDRTGQLVVRTADGSTTTVFAGDVVHVR